MNTRTVPRTMQLIASSNDEKNLMNGLSRGGKSGRFRFESSRSKQLQKLFSCVSTKKILLSKLIEIALPVVFHHGSKNSFLDLFFSSSVRGAMSKNLNCKSPALIGFAFASTWDSDQLGSPICCRQRFTLAKTPPASPGKRVIEKSPDRSLQVRSESWQCERGSAGFGPSFWCFESEDKRLRLR